MVSKMAATSASQNLDFRHCFNIERAFEEVHAFFAKVLLPYFSQITFIFSGVVSAKHGAVLPGED